MKACLEGGSHQLNTESVALVTKGVQFEAVQLEAKVRGAVPLTASVAWQYPEQGWSGSGPVSGSLELLELQQQVSGPYPFELDGTLAPVITSYSIHYTKLYELFVCGVPK